MVPDILSEKPVIKLLPNKSPMKPVIKHNIKALKNKIDMNYKNGICTIKLSSNLLKRIQSGEKLFMCMECDQIYTEHKDLLDHQIIHNKSDKKTIELETEIR